jgi:hypothetical protein
VKNYFSSVQKSIKGTRVRTPERATGTTDSNTADESAEQIRNEEED